MHWALSACLLLMSGRRGPPFGEGRPQMTDIAVATSPPSVTDAAADDAAATTTTERSPGSATVASDPSFLYPKSGLTINSIDELRIQYDTPWDELTLTVTCKGDGVGGTKSFDVSLDKASGSYTLSKIDGEITISEYPIDCSLILQDVDGVANFVVGPDFSVESTRGVASVYALSTTQALSGAAVATGSDSGPSTSGGAGDSASASGSDRSGPSATNAAASEGSDGSPTGVAGASESSSSDSSSSDGGLSGGAKAGIAFGVILGIAVLALGIFYFLRTRRRMEAMENELQETKKQHADERAYVDGILKVAGKPDTRNGGRVVMTETPNRGSGEWKKFFNSRAASSAAGTAPPSRLGTAVQTAPSPVPPSVMEGMSTAGGEAGSMREGSTVGLVDK